MILTIFKNSFSYSMREKGHKIQVTEQIELESTSEKFLHFSVYDPDRYDTKILLDLDKAKVLASCSCSTFQNSRKCRHIWGALIEADKDYFFEDIPDNILKHITLEPMNDVSEADGIASQEDQAIALFNRFNVNTSKTNNLEPQFKNIIYILNAVDNYYSENLEFKLYYQTRLASGKWSKERNYSTSKDDVVDLPIKEDRNTLDFLLTYDQNKDKSSRKIEIDKIHLGEAIKRSLATQRFYFQDNEGRHLVNSYNTKDAKLYFEIDNDEMNEKWVVKPRIRIGNHLKNTFSRQYFPIIRNDHIFHAGVIYKVDFLGLQNIFASSELKPEYHFRFSEKKKFLAFLTENLPNDSYKIPDNIELVVNQITPRSIFKIKIIEYKEVTHTIGELFFDYDGELEASGSSIRVEDTLYENDIHRFINDLEGTSPFYENNAQNEFLIAPDLFVDIVSQLSDEGIEVFANKQRVYSATNSSLNIEASGVDWFEVKGGVSFGSTYVSYPDLLKGTYKNQLVSLGNGKLGVMPHSWLKNQRALLQLSEEGEITEDGIKVHKTKAILIDHMFFEHERETDDYFRNFVSHIKNFKNIEEINESNRFKGELRNYQREGLSWLHFLKQVKLGGCLADDMGLGKTIQVLAHLDHHNKEEKRTSLIIAPRSLVTNWKIEAEKFTPHLKVNIYDGPVSSRAEILKQDSDILIMTYGILRSDIEILKKHLFEYVVLDEAQAIKNRNSQIAKCTYMLQSRYRLALTGTPVENSLDDLFSIFNFLAPGMFNKSQATSDRMDQNKVLESLQPFILRRIKEDVLDDLPEKTEKIIFCDLKEAHRKAYNELKDYYKSQLKKKVKKDGINKSKIQVLEALLRLRQAANHPALVNDFKGDSTKVLILMDRIRELVSSGKKVIIFSQFVKFLTMIRESLESESIGYEYLDGSSRKRDEIVRRFKTCKKTNLFLISIKAGGTGLNLTEADYCFILDPWWNPAVEAQAIDRIHRIGQKNKVFAYKLIAKDTVEDKILELQENKKDLSDSVLSADGSFIKNLTSDDLNYLLT